MDKKWSWSYLAYVVTWDACQLVYNLEQASKQAAWNCHLVLAIISIIIYECLLVGSSGGWRNWLGLGIWFTCSANCEQLGLGELMVDLSQMTIPSIQLYLSFVLLSSPSNSLFSSFLLKYTCPSILPSTPYSITFTPLLLSCTCPTIFSALLVIPSSPHAWSHVLVLHFS